ncbi:TPA: baseplate, partial [Escherichia coli]|nr:baseplate [Escherichia coli]
MTPNKTLLSRIGEWQTTRTGKFQTTGLERVDNAFATLISDIFSDVTLVEPA